MVRNLVVGTGTTLAAPSGTYRMVTLAALGAGVTTGRGQWRRWRPGMVECNVF